MIFAGLLAGVVARYWLWPKFAAARLVRELENAQRNAHDPKR